MTTVNYLPFAPSLKDGRVPGPVGSVVPSPCIFGGGHWLRGRALA
jgi:hypothetical protein